MITHGLEGAAEILHCEPLTVRALAAKGELRGAKIGKSWVFKQSDLEDYLEAVIARQTAERKGLEIKPGVNPPPLPVRRRRSRAEMQALRAAEARNREQQT